MNFHFISRLAERYHLYIDRKQYDAILYGALESVPLLVEPNGEEWHKVYFKGAWLYVLLRYCQKGNRRDGDKDGNELATVITKQDMEKKLMQAKGKVTG